MPFSRDDLVRSILEGWKQHQRPFAHNWSKNSFPNHAVSIRTWCAAQVPPIDWGALHGFPVQAAQRAEREQPQSRIAAWQEQGGRRRIMFSLSHKYSPQAFAAAAAVARANGFFLLP
jgi:hypothetical protein